jgi:hypothetical protein
MSDIGLVAREVLLAKVTENIILSTKKAVRGCSVRM